MLPREGNFFHLLFIGHRAPKIFFSISIRFSSLCARFTVLLLFDYDDYDRAEEKGEKERDEKNCNKTIINITLVDLLLSH